ncbi:hypothetical protein FQN55_003457 [Onygenales sp. PD_40]|nr:hypothetical protein FQN55_003457 [Onygenales sp. PD_40]KAK2781427.1 hypothetical protein FQN52_001619 [Onygenales sp. PD_12]KAK2784981.1 hypothetical protein FQN53_008032 [Emmonsiellopsis sp. PD_33]KAK2802876.1 hypothetical protein FQN51_004138 [Onygenales sp. PD_10]
MALGNKLVRAILFFTRFLQWGSAVIVMGIVSYFINKYSHDRGQHLKYWEIIAVLSVAFFLPGLLSPFIPVIGRFAFPIDIAFSYLWLTSFIFAAQDYNWRNCHDHSPPGGRCSLKYASEAFIFLAFFASLTAAMLEIYNLWSYHQRQSGTTSMHQKERPSGETGTTV